MVSSPYSRAVLVVAAILALLVIGCKTIHEEDLFFPRQVTRPPAAENRDDVSIQVANGETIGGWNLRVSQPRAQLIYFYGNGETVADSLRRMTWLSESWQVDVLCVDYRGYGFSQGKPSVDALLSDAVAAYDFIRPADSPAYPPVILFGRSLGTTAALHLAGERSVTGMILEAPFTNVDEVIAAWGRRLPGYLRWFVRLRPEASLSNRSPQPRDRMAAFTAPLLVIHGADDEVIPLSLGRQMYEVSPAAHKQWLEIAGCGHNNLSLNRPEVIAGLDTFFEQALNPPESGPAPDSPQ